MVASKAFLRAARSLINKYHPMLLCLLEPKISGTQADKVCRKLDFTNGFEWKRWDLVEEFGSCGRISGWWRFDSGMHLW